MILFDGESYFAVGRLQLTLENKKLKEANKAYRSAINSKADPATKDDVVGFAFAINGKFTCSDAFTSRALFLKMWPKLLEAASTEAIAEAEHDRSPLRDHVIIAGAGLAGLQLARSLRELEIPYIFVDLNAANIRAAVKRGDPACFGDVTSVELLEHIGAPPAFELVRRARTPLTHRLRNVAKSGESRQPSETMQEERSHGEHHESLGDR